MHHALRSHTHATAAHAFTSALKPRRGALHLHRSALQAKYPEQVQLFVFYFIGFAKAFRLTVS